MLEFNLQVSLGKMRVKYKESISQKYQIEQLYNKLINNKPSYICLELSAENIEEEETNPELQNNNEIIFDFQRNRQFDVTYQ